MQKADEGKTRAYQQHIWSRASHSHCTMQTTLRTPLVSERGRTKSAVLSKQLS